MRSPKDFFRPLAVGAPDPLREIPVRPSRMIHFFPPSNPKMVAKVPDIAPTVDILLANLEDGVPGRRQGSGPGRPGRGRPRTSTCGDTQLWTRVNSLDSPWGLDDLTAAVLEAGEALDVDHDPQGRGARGHPLRRPAARPARGQGRARPSRCSCTPSSRPPAAWPTSRRSARASPACRACRSARPTWPPTGA